MRTKWFLHIIFAVCLLIPEQALQQDVVDQKKQIIEEAKQKVVCKVTKYLWRHYEDPDQPFPLTDEECMDKKQIGFITNKFRMGNRIFIEAINNQETYNNPIGEKYNFTITDYNNVKSGEGSLKNYIHSIINTLITNRPERVRQAAFLDLKSELLQVLDIATTLFNKEEGKRIVWLNPPAVIKEGETKTLRYRLEPPLSDYEYVKIMVWPHGVISYSNTWPDIAENGELTIHGQKTGEQTKIKIIAVTLRGNIYIDTFTIKVVAKEKPIETIAIKNKNDYRYSYKTGDKIPIPDIIIEPVDYTGDYMIQYPDFIDTNDMLCKRHGIGKIIVYSANDKNIFDEVVISVTHSKETDKNK